jgi:hypothetical protein
VIHSLVGVHSTDNCQLRAKWIFQSVDSALSSFVVFPGRDIDSFNDELDKSDKFITSWAAAALDGELGNVTAPRNATHVLLAAQSADARSNLRTTIADHYVAEAISHEKPSQSEYWHSYAANGHSNGYADGSVNDPELHFVGLVKAPNGDACWDRPSALLPINRRLDHL